MPSSNYFHSPLSQGDSLPPRSCRLVKRRKAMAILLFALVALLAVLVLVGCGPGTENGGQSERDNSSAAPTATDDLTNGIGGANPSTALPLIPTLTLPPASSLTAEAALTVIPVPTDIPGLQATQIARATLSPIPPAEVGAVQVGPPLAATARRAGLSLELQLAGDTYLAGENGRALVTLRNDSSGLLFAGNIRLQVQDEAGQPIEPFPLPVDRPEGPFEGELLPLQPGETISRTLPFQMPSLDRAHGHTYTAQATGQLSRADIQHPDRSDNVPADLETAPVQLRVTEPTAQQHLKAELQATRQGYTLHVTGADGKPVEGPLWGAINVYSGKGGMSGALQGSSSGVWTSGWAEYLTEGGTPLQIKMWVAARGYLPAIVEETVPGSGDGTGTQAPSSPPPLPVYTAVPTAATAPSWPASTSAQHASYFPQQAPPQEGSMTALLTRKMVEVGGCARVEVGNAGPCDSGFR